MWCLCNFGAPHLEVPPREARSESGNMEAVWWGVALSPSPAEPGVRVCLCLLCQATRSLQHPAATHFKLVLLFSFEEPQSLCFTEDTWGGKKHTLVLALAHSSDGFSTQVDHFYLLLVNQFFFNAFLCLSWVFITSLIAMIVVTFFSSLVHCYLPRVFLLTSGCQNWGCTSLPAKLTVVDCLTVCIVLNVYNVFSFAVQQL